MLKLLQVLLEQPIKSVFQYILDLSNFLKDDNEILMSVAAGQWPDVLQIIKVQNMN